MPSLSQTLKNINPQTKNSNLGLHVNLSLWQDDANYNIQDLIAIASTSRYTYISAEVAVIILCEWVHVLCLCVVARWRPCWLWQFPGGQHGNQRHHVPGGTICTASPPPHLTIFKQRPTPPHRPTIHAGATRGQDAKVRWRSQSSRSRSGAEQGLEERLGGDVPLPTPSPHTLAHPQYVPNAQYTVIMNYHRQLPLKTVEGVCGSWWGTSWWVGKQESSE